MSDAASTAQLIVQPADGTAPVLRFIAAAEKTLQFKQFKFDEAHLVEAVLAAHRRGVAVRGMFNPADAGGIRYNDATFAAFEQAGIAVRWTNPEFAVSHEKTIVVDNARVLLTTFNLSDKYFHETRDAGVILDSPAVVEEVNACFEADWERRPFVPHVPELVWGNVSARAKLAAFIDGARKHLDVYHPKYVDLPILERLAAARQRGIHVRVLCGGKRGIKTWDLLDTLSTLRLLRSAGVKVHRTQQFKVHLKLIIADHERALLGSMNIHRDAFDRRREVGVLLEPGHVVERLRLLFAADWDHSHDYDVPDPLVPHETHPQDEPSDDPDFVHD